MRLSEQIPLLNTTNSTGKTNYSCSATDPNNMTTTNSKDTTTNSEDTTNNNSANKKETFPFRVWCALFVVIPLTVWVRGAIVHQVRVAEVAKAEELKSNNKHNHDQEADVDDPCGVYRSCSSCTFSRFKYFSSGVGSRQSCSWCPLSGTCYLPAREPDNSFCVDHNRSNTTFEIAYEYNCPLGPTPYPDDPPTLLPNWMGEFYQAGILDHVRLVDLSLPGTHDSLSYDLSLTVSQDGIDNLERLASLLHTLSGGMLHLLPGDLEEFFRMQGKTQQLTLPQQLDNGIRFLDVRIMWEHDKKEWYSIHFMQSKHPAEHYLRQIRTWMDDHPHEVIVLWLSKHGSTTATGEHQYPGVSPAQKQQFWNKYTSIFDGLLLETNESSIFDTPISQLIQRNHRIISYISDYKEFTQSSTQALNAAKIQNVYDDGDGVFHEENLLQTHIDYFKNATINNGHINAYGGFALLGMNTASPGWQIISAAKRQFLHWMKDLKEPRYPTTSSNKHIRSVGGQDEALQQQHFLSMPSPLWGLMSSVQRQVLHWLGGTLQESELQMAQLQFDIFFSCGSHIKIPGVDHWCPLNLLDIAQLASYYNQVAIEEAYKHSYDGDDGDSKRVLSAFPNAFYLDGYDYDGTIRVGAELLDGQERGEADNPNKDAKYAIVDTLLAYNANVACQLPTTNSSGCEGLLDRITKRRSRYPLQRWDEPKLGRHDDWPPYSYDAPIRRGHPGLAKQSTIWRQR